VNKVFQVSIHNSTAKNIVNSPSGFEPGSSVPESDAMTTAPRDQLVVSIDVVAAHVLFSRQKIIWLFKECHQRNRKGLPPSTTKPDGSNNLYVGMP
jgi:hypothetical protein